MKKLFLILSLCFFGALHGFAQEDDSNDNAGDKIREKMAEFIQKRMNLSKTESEKFAPVFFRYFKDWRTTIRENKGDRVQLQLRVAELRIRYRTEFKDIVGERRCNQIYEQQEKFIDAIRKVREEQLQRRPPPVLRRNRLMAD